eukprot:CAMPEP_0118657836 /NCGR_PEP_ID=MMETSP0785-20121206/14239_1 /TAXON_ID=91992 /ORGANISM="Bolidomonas pacifica, Strain CCMP 1866" /LENGTH=576 /DNA_ID=CAMNT_0006550797 /DNA_START=32 /DNA_END=1759 /DNA_ORIENTATION=+
MLPPSFLRPSISHLSCPSLVRHSTVLSSTQATHEVRNQAKLQDDINLFDDNATLSGYVRSHSSPSSPNLPTVLTHLSSSGSTFGSSSMRENADSANMIKPALQTHDIYGNRVDRVVYNEAYHEIMKAGIESGVTSMPWDDHPVRCRETPHLHRASLIYMLNQLDPGPCCPIVMTFAATSTIAKHGPNQHKDSWMSKLTSRSYDSRDVEIGCKTGVTIGMSMTEKQSGSDVRTNTTKATKIEEDVYALVGHKWFTSAPNSDGFLTLAKVNGDDDKMSCFLVPRVLPDGSRNAGLQFQRLKDKMGDHSNASSEVEYRNAVGFLCGEVGRGVPTIIDMVHHTRLECGLGSAGAMDRAYRIAENHCSQRVAFGAPLADQPLMRHLLMDLELDNKASTLLAMRMAKSFDNPEEAAFGRVGVPVMKFFLCKKQPNFIYECMEIMGGNGYVESWPMARMFRASPLNSIWEGSGNVMALDVVRAFGKGKGHIFKALSDNLEGVEGKDGNVDKHWEITMDTIDKLTSEDSDPGLLAFYGRKITADLAVGLQAVEMIKAANECIVTEDEAGMFVSSRIGEGEDSEI